MRQAALPFTKTVGLPPEAVPPCGGLGGQACGNQLSPTRCQPMPFTKTSPEPAAFGRGGQHPCPVPKSPFLCAAGISSPLIQINPWGGHGYMASTFNINISSSPNISSPFNING